MVSPAIAKPLGCLVTPTPERMSPNNQSSQLRKGAQHNRRAIKANTNPAVPTPLLFEDCCWIMIVCLLSPLFCPCGVWELVFSIVLKI